MSGPKIVIVKSEAQLQRERERALRDLARTSARWHELLDRSGELNADKMTLMQSRTEALAEQFKLGHELALNEIAKEIQFLQSDIESAQNRAIEKRVQQLTVELKRKRLGKSSAALAETDAAQLKEILLGDRRQTEEIAGVSEECSIYEPKDELISDLSRDLIPAQVVSKEIHTQGDENPTVSNKRLLMLLAQIQLFESVYAEQFSKRLHAIELESDPGRSRLLADSLVLDMARFCKQQKQIDYVRQIMLAARAALEDVADEASSAVLAQIDNVLKTPEKISLLEAQDLQNQAEKMRLAFFAKEDAREKRKAILESFAAIGYEVKEGMSTAWAKNGRIVLAKAGCPDEGVEIASAEGLERLQVRAVAMVARGTQHNTARDTEIETKWCSSFDKLREDLAQKGQNTKIATALPIGSAPLKVCMSPASQTEDNELDSDFDEDTHRPASSRRQSRST